MARESDGRAQRNSTKEFAEDIQMRHAKKRDPSKEPFASTISDGQRLALIERISTREASDADADTYFRDRERAYKKIIVAKDQLATPSDPHKAVFSHPDLSDASAMATATVYASVDWPVVKAGVSARRTQKKAGMGRHSEFNDPSTSARYKARRAAWQAVDAESKAKGRDRLRGRALANAIACKTGERFNTIRTWMKKEQADRARRKAIGPSIVPGDWRQLMG